MLAAQPTLKYSLTVQEDGDPPDPRTDWDHLGTMVCFHKKYRLGDQGHGIRSSDFGSWDEMAKHIVENLKAEVLLPIYMYDHSGITISVFPFSCPWDSGQIGFVYATKEEVKEWFSIKRVTKKYIDKALQVLQNEISVYDRWLRGEVYCWEIRDQEGEITDSCCGYYDEDQAKEDGRLRIVELEARNENT